MSNRVQADNDVFRKSLGHCPIPGRLVVTRGVHQDSRIQRILFEVRSFKDFNRDNDPHGEHDFGKFSVDGRDFFFKFDYYALDGDQPDFESGADPHKEPCYRILTVMRCDEY